MMMIDDDDDDDTIVFARDDNILYAFRRFPVVVDVCSLTLFKSSKRASLK